MRKLVLEIYVWDYSNAEFQQTWDFSRLRSLVLDCRALDFLKRAPTEDLTRLESLTLRLWNSWDTWHPDITSFPTYLENVLARLPLLKKLKIVADSWLEDVPINAIVNLPNLEKLVIRELCRPDYGYTRLRPDSLMLRTVHLGRIQANCPNITSLGLDIFMCNTEAEDFLYILSEFEHLRNLTLWSTLSLDAGAFEGSEDPDYDGAKDIMAHLPSRKEGVAFDLLEIILLIFGDENTDAEERLFASRISEMGVYEQWGSEKHPKPDLVEGEGAYGEEEADM